MTEFFAGKIKKILSSFKKPNLKQLPGQPKPDQKPEICDDSPLWLKIARSQVGVKEMAGPLDNPQIIRYHMSTLLDKNLAQHDETPWCSSFVNWCMREAGRVGTDSAWAKSWIKWGYPLDIPRKGCVAVFSRGEVNGHVGFFIKEIGENVIVLGGNQKDSVCEALYPKSRLLGYRWPVE